MIEVVKKAAVEAGEFLKRNFGTLSASQIFSKGDRNFATAMDHQAEAMIVRSLKAAFPDYGILGEENSRHNIAAENLWIIDPLDGTHNYMRGINVYGVSIGLWQKNQFTLGVVYMPETGELYSAEKGKGTLKNGKPIKVSRVGGIKECCLSFDSTIRYQPELMLSVLGDLSRQVFNVRMFGSSARILTYLAEGTIDCSVEFCDQPWDFAGSVCLIEEAGGVINPLKREESLNPRTVGYIAANPFLYPQVRDIVDKHF